jgi:hypothetical protein
MSRKSRTARRATGLVAVVLFSAWALAAANTHADSPVPQAGAQTALAAPKATGPQLNYQGRLLDGSGNPITGTRSMTFKLYGVATGGTALWTEGPKNVTATNGQFSTLLGDTTALVLTIFDGRDLWLGVTVGSDAEASPRIQVAYSPYALYAGNAVKLGGQTSDAFAPAAHSHAGEQITSGTVADARVAGTIARDAEIMPAVLAADGAGSGLDADLLDGQQAAAFAPTAHNHDAAYVNDNAGEVGTPDVPAGALSPDRIAGTAWTSANDGAGSGLDADRLDGQEAVAFAAAGHNHLGDTWNLSTDSTGLALGGTVWWANSLLQAFNHGNGPSIWGINDGGGNGVRGQGGGASLGVYGQAENAAGVAGRSSGNDGVAGVSSAAGRSGVYGNHEGSGYGVGGMSQSGIGVYGKDAGPNPDDSWAVWADGDMRTTGDLTVELTLYVGGYATFAGGKNGFVVDVAQNDDTVALQPGDVVSISGAGPAVVGEIPVIKVRRATAATATGVMGVVDGRFLLAERSSVSGGEGAKSTKREAKIEAVAIDPGQYLTVVTLGAYKAIKVDATYGPVAPGDLLVASPNPGYAMRSAAPLAGTVIGKSAGSLAKGTGVVPVLITLQ